MIRILRVANMQYIFAGFNPAPAGPGAQGGDVTTQDQEKVTNEIARFCSGSDATVLLVSRSGVNLVLHFLCRRPLSCKS